MSSYLELKRGSASTARTRADERRVLIQLRAGALSFNVLCVVLVGGFIVQVVRGQGSGPFMWLGALAGAVYIASTAYFSRRG